MLSVPLLTLLTAGVINSRPVEEALNEFERSFGIEKNRPAQTQVNRDTETRREAARNLLLAA